MLRKYRLTGGSCLFVFSLLLCGATCGSLSRDAGGDFTFWVSVQSVEKSGVMVTALSGHVLDLPVRIVVNDETISQYASGRPLDLSSIAAGTLIQVKAEWTEDGLVAKSVSLNDPNQVTVTGLVEDATAERIVVGGLEFKIAESTTMDQTPEAGKIVVVQGSYAPDGSLLAASIEQQSRMKLFGRIDQINSDGTVVISSRTVRLTDQTVIEGAGNSSLSAGDLVVGQYVEASAELQAGTLVARKVTTSDPLKISIEGIVTAFDTKSVSIKVATKNVIITVDSKTVITGTLSVGAAVHAVASLGSDGSLLALTIAVKVPLAAVTGTISGIVATSSTIVVGGTTIHVDDITKIVSLGKTLSFADLKAGDKVALVGVRQSDGSILAQKIEVIPVIVPPATVTGAIDSVGTDSFVVAKTTVKVDKNTRIASLGKTLAFGDLKVGTKVFVVGTKQSDGSILAQRVEVLPVVVPPATVTGVIDSIGTDSFVVAKTTVKVDKNTKISSLGRAHSFGDLKVGSKVAVVGVRQSDGSILAQKIEVLPTVVPPAIILGAIESIDGSSFVVSKTTVKVDSSTKITSFLGKRLTFGDLKVGSKVAVVGARQSDGSILAQRIEVAL